MLRKFRLKLIRGLVELNEILIFNRRLIKFYKKELSTNIKNIIDVGINTGQSIDIFRNIDNNCTIFGFEPNPDLFENLLKKYANDDSIHLYQIGISNSIGTKIFYENILHSTSTLEEIDINSNYLSKKASILGVNKEEIFHKSYKIETISLSSFINENFSTDIDIVKIDTEGHEYSCLEGLFASPLKVKVKYIQIEEHSDDMYINKKSFVDLCKLLEQNNYKIAARIKHGFGDFYDVIFKHIAIS